MGFNPGIQGWFNICTHQSSDAPHCKMESKNYTVIPIDAENFWHNLTSFYDKNSQQSRCRGNVSQHKKKDQMW